MRTLSAGDLLAVWEQGSARSAVERALLLVTAASPGMSLDAVAALRIGQRDRYLLDLRERIFGPALNSLATCPGCHAVLELAFTAADIRVAAPDQLAQEGCEHGMVFSLQAGGYDMQIRLPDSRDLEAAAGEPNAADARRRLFERCIVSAVRNGVCCPANQVPEDVVQMVEERMADSDPQGDPQLSLTCPQCGYRWQAGFDITSFFWSEIHAWALQLLREVHMLASAYGWREADILALSPSRRQAYLELVGR